MSKEINPTPLFIFSPSFRDVVFTSNTIYKKWVLICILILEISFSTAQTSINIDSLRKNYEQATTIPNRIKCAHHLCNELNRIDPSAAIEIAKQILQMIDSLERAGVAPDSVTNSRRLIFYSNLSASYHLIGDLKEQLKILVKSLEMAQQMKSKTSEIMALEKIGSYYSDLGHFKESLQYFRRALSIAYEIDNTYLIALNLGNSGSILEEENLDSALWYYRRSFIEMQKPEMNDRAGAMGWLMENIGSVFEKKGIPDSALYYYNLSYAYRKSIDHRLGQYLVLNSIARLLMKQDQLEKALSYSDRSIRLAVENNFRMNLYESYEVRSKILRKLGRFKEALEDHLRFVEERDSIISENNTKNIVQQTMRYEYGRKLLADSLEYLRKEGVLTERSEKQRIGLVASISGLLLLIALVYTIFKGKKRSDELLLNILPEETAMELKRKGSAEAKLIDQVTVMFTDFKNFTQASEQLTPAELVAEIHFCYSEFDKIISRHNLEKIKTIGDSYMCAGGLPVTNTTNAEDTLRAALEIRNFMEAEREKHMASGKPFFEIRIGCHTGPVVAGIVGIKKFAYDIWGDTVNIASRMESSGEAGKINISGSTYLLVKDKFNCEYRGKIQAKNKGEIDMYFVEGISNT